MTLALFGAAPVAAQDAGQGWQALARADGQAALALIEQNHPGAAPELADRDFLTRLEKARAMLAERLAQVASFESHAMLMLGLANSFGDSHIWSSALVQPRQRIWAGLVLVRRGDKWTIGAQDVRPDEPKLEGARLLSCDGQSAEALVRARIGGFFANPDDEAAMAGNAWQFFIDSDAPFYHRPASCRFTLADGAERDVDLVWRPIAGTQLQPMVVKALRPARAGMGISDFAGGKWIALETLDARAESVASEVERRRAELRAAPVVVVDLRGNGGGNSDYAERIARALAGEQRVAAATGTDRDACSGSFWRASPDNLRTLETTRDALRDDPESAAYYASLAQEMAAANKEDRAFAPALPACAARATPARSAPAKLPASAMKGRLVLVTDRACFSSCLIATDIFRRIGALHVGETTDRSTRYMEVREITLPSGLRTFSTLQKLALGMADFGPYRPARAYPGFMDDTESLKAWVARIAAQP